MLFVNLSEFCSEIVLMNHALVAEEKLEAIAVERVVGSI